MSRGAYVVSLLRNAGVTSRTRNGKVQLQPKAKLTNELRALVKQHEAELIVELQRWPNAIAPARNYQAEPIRRDELAQPEPRWPVAVVSRRPWRRR
jgi:hypothetical protein